VAEVEQLTGPLPPSIKSAFLQGGLETAYNEAVQKRREAKRGLAELERIAPPSSLEGLGDIKKLDAQLKILLRIRELKEDISNTEDKDKIKKRIQDIEQKIQSAQFICPELKKPCPVSEVQTAFSADDGLLKERARLELKLEILNNTKKELKQL